MKMRMLIGILLLAAVMLTGCNAPTITKTSTPTKIPGHIAPNATATTEPSTKFDLTGSWTGTLTQELQSGLCGGMLPQQGDVQIMQTGDSFTMQFGAGFACDPVEACYFTGNVDGETYTAMNSGFADDEGGVYASSLTIVPMEPNSVEGFGVSTYTHTDGSCEWATSLFLIR
jgi:hypothetical protein